MAETTIALQKRAQQFQQAVSSGDWQKALIAINALLEATPGEVSLLYNRALVLKNLMKPEDARKAFEGVLDQYDGHLKARFELASIYLEMNAFDKAIQHLSNYLTSRPDDGDALLNIGNAYLYSNQVQTARDFLSKAHTILNSELSAQSLAIAERDCGNLDACNDLLDGLPHSPEMAATRLKIQTQGPKGCLKLAVSGFHPTR
ncbi:MAG: tetratricopeptide repeat protein [Stappiaceae bacterium]